MDLGETGFDNIPHYTYSRQREGGEMLTFTWDGLFSHPIKVSRDGYGEPARWTIVLEDPKNGYTAPEWLQDQFGEVDTCDWWSDHMDGDPTYGILQLFQSICRAWYEKFYKNPEVS